MAAKCFSLIGGVVLRATRLDGCGRPLFGDCAQVVSDGFVTLSATANVDEGDEINVKKANGKTCIQKQPCPTLNGYGVEIEFCEVDPDMWHLMTGNEAILDPDGDAIGLDVDGDVSSCDSGFALEIWSEVASNQCEDDEDGAWGYILFPFLQGGVFGDFTIENDAVTFTMTGANTKKGSAWGVGPYNVQNGVGGVAGPLLTPVKTSTYMRLFRTTIAPPEAACGCQPLLDTPPGPVATGAIAGSPGSFTPVGANPPDNLAALTPGVVASPATAWLDGQYVVLDNGTFAHWTGAAWAAGIAD